jgi:hypothetical protein
MTQSLKFVILLRDLLGVLKIFCRATRLNESVVFLAQVGFFTAKVSRIFGGC